MLGIPKPFFTLRVAARFFETLLLPSKAIPKKKKAPGHRIKYPAAGGK